MWQGNVPLPSHPHPHPHQLHTIHCNNVPPPPSFTGPVHLHAFSFTSYFPEGVACMVYHSNHNLLLVGGSQGEGCGVSGWRLLDGAPHWGPKLGQRIEKVCPNDSCNLTLRLSTGQERIHQWTHFQKEELTPKLSEYRCCQYSDEVMLTYFCCL